MEEHQVVSAAHHEQVCYGYALKHAELNHRISMLRNLAVTGWVLFVVSLIVRGHQ